MMYRMQIYACEKFCIFAYFQEYLLSVALKSEIRVLAFLFVFSEPVIVFVLAYIDLGRKVCICIFRFRKKSICIFGFRKKSCIFGFRKKKM